MSLSYADVMPRTPFANWLYRFRFSRGWTQRELADTLWMSEAAVQQWESGTRTPRGATIVLLAKLAHEAGFEPPPEVKLGRGPRERQDDE